MNVSPDGVRYLCLAREQKVPRPFQLRWLAPAIVGDDLQAWTWLARISVLGIVGGAVWYAGWAGLLIVGLAGVVKITLRFPVLVDAPAYACALLAAAAWTHDQPIVAVLFVLWAGGFKETAPVFAAVWAWHPLLLVGLAVPLLRVFVKAGDDPFADGRYREWGTFSLPGQARPDPLIVESLAHPIRAAWDNHRLAPAWWWVLPWGVLLAGLTAPSWQLGVCLALAYAQCVIATDTVRLYQWAAPCMCVAFAAAVPVAWFLPLLAVHLVNPYATEGL